LRFQGPPQKRFEADGSGGDSLSRGRVRKYSSDCRGLGGFAAYVRVTMAADADGDRGRAERARDERMRVTATESGRYEVATESGNAYEVDLERGRCACPDHQFRGVRCKHLRRVAMEVTAGTVPAPGERAAACANCGGRVHVDEDAPNPVYCGDCTLEPGEFVVDRETGDLVVVVETTGERADEVDIPSRGWTVADHYSNEDYDPSDVVVDVLYPLDREATPSSVEARPPRRYAFPRGRLRRPAESES
jgi:hypothetical protein